MKDLNDFSSQSLPIVTETPKNIISKRPLELPVSNNATKNDTQYNKNTSITTQHNNDNNDNSKKKKTKRFPLHVEAIVNPCCPISFHLLQSEIESFVRNVGQNTFMVCFIK